MPDSALLKPPPDETDTMILQAVTPAPDLSPGRRALPWIIAALLALVFLADLHYPEYLHIGILFNVCIALTLWSWRPRWVVGVTALSVALRLVAHTQEALYGDHIGYSEAPAVDAFNLSVGIAVQTLTGALIWRQVLVQQRLEARERQTREQARALAMALRESKQARRAAEEATRQARAAREREGKTLEALRRVRGLSLALNRAVLPEVPASIAGGRVTLAARYAPAEREIMIGGDFYDLITLDEPGGRYGLVIGDVAGHGVEAAAQTALVTTTLRTCAFDSGDGPAQVLSRVARALEGQLESFVSLFYGVYDVGPGELTYANAGHEPPILVGPDGPAPLRPTGPILGIGLSTYTETRLVLQAGCTLVLMTDGLTEVRREAGEMLDWEGLADIAVRQADRETDVSRVADGILRDVRSYAGSGPLSDDVALLIARVTA